MKFTEYRPGARKFTSRLSKISSTHTDHPFIQQSSFNRRRFWIRFFGVISTLTFVGLIALIVLTLFSFVIFAKDLPSPNKLTTHDASLSTKIYDRNGKLLYDIYGEKNRALAAEKGERALGALMGDAMRELKGGASGEEISRILREELSKKQSRD